MQTENGARPELYAAVFLVSLASLALEVLQMRIFAFALWHHLAFLVISIAILGFAAAGAVQASSRRLREAPLERSLPCAGLAFALSALLGPAFLAWRPIDVFGALGAAMQRFGLLLGHPTYSISVTMATFLVVSGLGSLVSGALPDRALARALCVVAGVLAVATLALQLGLPALTQTALAWPFAGRAALTIALVAPMAFAMGICFPSGIRVVKRRDAALIPWAYGVNGAGTVLGSVLAVCLAIGVGFARVQWIAAAMYVLAAILMLRMTRETAVR